MPIVVPLEILLRQLPYSSLNSLLAIGTLANPGYAIRYYQRYHQIDL